MEIVGLERFSSQISQNPTLSLYSCVILSIVALIDNYDDIMKEISSSIEVTSSTTSSLPLHLLVSPPPPVFVTWMNSSNRPLQLQATRQPFVHQFLVTRKRFLVSSKISSQSIIENG